MIERIVKAVKTVVQSDEFVPLHEPVFNGNEQKYVKDCIDSTFVSSVGKYVERFEKDLADFVGAKRAVAVVNGTAALHISLLLAEVEQGDEVLIPSLTFIATANAVSYCGAIPHFVDVEERTLGLDPYKLSDYLNEIGLFKQNELFNKKTGRRIKAVVPMHTFGHPVDLDPLVEVCNRFKLVLVEDAAESLGSYYKGVHTGNFGKLSAFSFNGNKIITTGGGGAIVTNDEKLADFAKHLTTTAKVPHKWEYVHDHIGYNYRMPNINAALGVAQLEQLPKFIELKRKLSQKYKLAFQHLENIKLFQEVDDVKSNYWLQVLILDNNTDIDFRDNLLDELNNEKLMSRPIWNLISSLPIYRECPKMDLNTSIDLEKRIVNIPSGTQIGS